MTANIAIFNNIVNQPEPGVLMEETHVNNGIFNPGHYYLNKANNYKINVPKFQKRLN